MHQYHIGIAQLTEYRNTVLYDLVVTTPEDFSVQAIESPRMYPSSHDIARVLFPHKLRSEFINAARPPRDYMDLLDCGINTFLHEYFPKQHPSPNVESASLAPLFSIIIIPVRTTIEDFRMAQTISSFAWFSPKQCNFLVLKTEKSEDRFVETLATVGPVAPLKFSFRSDGASLTEETIGEGKALWGWLRITLAING